MEHGIDELQGGVACIAIGPLLFVVGGLRETPSLGEEGPWEALEVFLGGFRPVCVFFCVLRRNFELPPPTSAEGLGV